MDVKTNQDMYWYNVIPRKSRENAKLQRSYVKKFHSYISRDQVDVCGSHAKLENTSWINSWILRYVVCEKH